jgi:hypothetical protein
MLSYRNAKGKGGRKQSTSHIVHGRDRREKHPVRLAYQPLANSTFLSDQTSCQQSANSIFLSE